MFTLILGIAQRSPTLISLWYINRKLKPKPNAKAKSQFWPNIFATIAFCLIISSCMKTWEKEAKNSNHHSSHNNMSQIRPINHKDILNVKN